MGIKIVRNDIVRMECDAIVNPANEYPTYKTGCDYAIYNAAGKEELLKLREKIGRVKEGEVFITPGLKLRAKYIIHAVSPMYIDGEHGEEEKLRSCYRKSLELARQYKLSSIAFPLIGAGGFRHPREKSLRIAMDEFNTFLLKHEMEITLVLFGQASIDLGRRIAPKLEAYIDSHYVRDRYMQEYGRPHSPNSPSIPGSLDMETVDGKRKWAARPPVFGSALSNAAPSGTGRGRARARAEEERAYAEEERYYAASAPVHGDAASAPGIPYPDNEEIEEESKTDFLYGAGSFEEEEKLLEKLNRELEERIAHREDTFSEYLMYLIGKKGMDNSEVYKNALVDKKVFSKIKNNKDYHPQKSTALCLCIGAKLNMDETKDLLSRAGYALSPSNITDIIFSFFIEQGIYDMFELDIQLEEHGAQCLIPG